MTDHRADIDRLLQGVKPGQEFRNGQRRTAVWSLYYCGDSLADVVLSGGYIEDPFSRVAMNVDESRCDHLAADIDDARR